MQDGDEEKQLEALLQTCKMFYENSKKNKEITIKSKLKDFKDGYNVLKNTDETNLYENNVIKNSRNQKFQLYYICPECGHKGKHFIHADQEYVTCHEHDIKMKVRQATHNYLQPDEYGNYFIAGEFRKTLKDAEDENESA